MKRNDKKSVLNIPREWATMAVVIAAQVTALTLVACFVRGTYWMAWTVTAIISASTLYFIAMFVYKIYRGRLCRVVFSESGIKYSKYFSENTIESDSLRVEAFSYGKNDDKVTYVRLYDDSSENADAEGIVVSLTFKRLCRLSNNIPAVIVEYALKTTSNKMLEAMKRYAPQSLTAEIDKELAERKAKADSEEQSVKIGNRKKKKRRR